MGKNVKGFAIGDRCVADVGITVSRNSATQTTQPLTQDLTLLNLILSSLVPCSSSFDRDLSTRHGVLQH